MFDCQRDLLSFLYLGRSDNNCLTLSGKEVEKVVTETGSLQRDFNKDVFCKSGRKQSQFAHAVFLFYLAGNGCLGQKQVFRLSKEVDCFGYRMPGFVFQGQLHEAMAQVIRKRALCRKKQSGERSAIYTLGSVGRKSQRRKVACFSAGPNPFPLIVCRCRILGPCISLISRNTLARFFTSCPSIGPK